MEEKSAQLPPSHYSYHFLTIMPNADCNLETMTPATGISAQFLATFIRLQAQLDRHYESVPGLLYSPSRRQSTNFHNLKFSAEPVVVDGHTLSIADVVAVARYGAPVQLSSAADVRKRVERSQQTIESKLAAGASVYGLSTGAFPKIS